MHSQTSFLAITILSVAAVATPVVAQTQFTPSIAAEAAYSDNLAYDAAGSSSDTAYVLALDLPVTRQWRSGQMSFRYSPTAYKFQDATALDRVDHTLSLGFQSTLSRRSSLGGTFGFSRSQLQGSFTAIDDPDLILTQRSDRDRISADINYGLQVAPRWTWNISAGGGSTSYETISGFTGGGLEDRDEFHVSTGVGKQVSQKTTVGANVRYAENRLDTSGDEEVRTASLYVTRQIDKVSSINASLGYFSAESMIPGVSDRTGASVRFGYSRTFRTVTLSTSLGHQPTSGGNLPGTATFTNLGVQIAGNQLQRWTWSLGAAFSRRDPAASADPEIDAYGLRGALTWTPIPKFGVRLRAGRNQQESAAPMTPDIDVFRATLGVVWFPKG